VAVRSFPRSPRDWRLLAEAAVVLLLVRAALAAIPFSTLQRRVARVRSRKHLFERDAIVCVTRAVRAVARRLPVRTTCLVETLAAHAMLRRRGYHSVVRFGVKSPSAGARTIEAHAWLEHEGTVIVGQVDNLRDYAAFEADEERKDGSALGHS
jgi:hypothetical protein